MSERIPVWSWESAVVATDVPPLTKLVCLNIARYLSSTGKGWRLTVEAMTRDTGLSDRAVRIHLAKAQKAGLLAIIRHHDIKGHRTATEYRPRFPRHVVLDDQPAELPTLPASRAGRAKAYRHVVPVGRDAGQVPFQDLDTRKNRLPTYHVRGRGRVARTTENPLDAWGAGE